MALNLPQIFHDILMFFAWLLKEQRWSKRLLVFVPSIVIVAMLILASATLYKPYVPTTRSGQFTVIGNKIYDPKGNIFIVKGVATVYGAFAGGDESGYGTTNYQNAQCDFDIQKSMGVNTVRIFVVC